MPGIFDPLVPQSFIDPLQRKLDQRRLDQSPDEARLRGFGAGALEGLRGLTSPANLAGLLPGGAAAKLLKLVPRAARAAGPTLELLEELPAVRQVMPTMDEVGGLLNAMQRNLARVPTKGIPAASAGPVVQGLKRAGSNPFADEFAEEAFRKYTRR